MGWSLGRNENRPEGDQDIGYSVGAECDVEGCKTMIDRGLSYCCGGELYGEPYGCGGFFCENHRHYYFTDDYFECMSPSQLCEKCGLEWEKKKGFDVVSDYEDDKQGWHKLEDGPEIFQGPVALLEKVWWTVYKVLLHESKEIWYMFAGGIWSDEGSNVEYWKEIE